MVGLWLAFVLGLAAPPDVDASPRRSVEPVAVQWTADAQPPIEERGASRPNSDEVSAPEPDVEPQPPVDEAFEGADAIGEPAAGAPAAADASGVVTGDPLRRKRALWIPRVILYSPRLAVRMIAMPIKAFAFLYDRYQLPVRFADIFFMDDEKAAVLPLLQTESGLRQQYGARAFHKDLFGKKERISGRFLFGSFGQRFLQLKLTTGNRISKRVSARITSQFWQERNQRFFGIGNGDLDDSVSGGVDGPNIDPIASTRAIDTRFKEDHSEYRAGLNVKLVPGLSFGASTALEYRHFSSLGRNEFDAVNTASVYDTADLVGYRGGLAASKTGAGLAYNNFRRTAPWISKATPSTGWKITGLAEYTDGIARSDPSQFVNYSVDIQRLINLYRGDRVLHLRLYWEGVTGSMREIPFVRLPQLGGPVQLRGFPRFRFRDRLATFTVIEYRYPIGEVASGYLFLDSGRTFRAYEDIEFRKWRAGGGPGLILHTRQSFLARMFVAFATDGSIFFNLNFDPLST